MSSYIISWTVGISEQALFLPAIKTGKPPWSNLPSVEIEDITEIMAGAVAGAYLGMRGDFFVII